MKLFLSALVMGFALFCSIAGAGEIKNTATLSIDEAPELGPPVGEAIPHDLNLIDDRGAQQDFSKLTGEKGVLLVFVRSLDWCPYCQAQTLDIAKHINEFEDRGLRVVFLSYDAPEIQRRFKKKWDINPVILSDGKSEAIKSFGLLNEGMKPESRYYGVPHPAIFVISKEKTVATKLYEDDYLSNAKSYRNRPEISLILNAVDAAIAENRL